MIRTISDWFSQLHRCIDALDVQRIEVQTSLFLLSYLLTLFNALIGIGVLAILIFGYRRSWTLRASLYVERYQLLLAIILPAMVLLGIAVAIGPMASDDLLRDLIIGQHYEYDYSKLYPISDLPPFDMWWGFDHALSWMQTFVSAKVAMWLLQAAIYAGMTFIVARAVMSILAERPDRVYWAGIAVAITIYLSIGRIALARPEIILTVWALTAVLVRSKFGIAAWVMGGIALCSTYWLAFLYFASVLLQTGWRQKVAVFAVLAASHLTFWAGMFGIEYFKALDWLPQVLENQIAVVSENTGLEALIGSPLILGMVSLVAIGLFVQPRRDFLTYAAVLGFFLASNQVRYIGMIAPLLVLLTFMLWQHKLPNLRTGGMLAAACLCFFMQFETAKSIPSIKQAPHFQLPLSARVMTAYDLATYAVPFDNPGIQIEPSYAFGAAPKDIQQLALDIGGKGGQPSCNVLLKHGFTHVVEQTMTGDIPACLELAEVNKKWRLWHVR